MVESFENNHHRQTLVPFLVISPSFLFCIILRAEMPCQLTKIKNWTKQKCESISTPSSLTSSSHLMFTFQVVLFLPTAIA